MGHGVDVGCGFGRVLEHWFGAQRFETKPDDRCSCSGLGTWFEAWLEVSGLGLGFKAVFLGRSLETKFEEVGCSETCLVDGLRLLLGVLGSRGA